MHNAIKLFYNLGKAFFRRNAFKEKVIKYIFMFKYLKYNKKIKLGTTMLPRG